LLFTPDLSLLGYLNSLQAGALTYNFVHFKALGISLFIIGAILTYQPLQLAGLILFGHTSLDRVLGYGMKYPDAFKHTYLGTIGEA